MRSSRAEAIERAMDVTAAVMVAGAVAVVLTAIAADPALRFAVAGLAFAGCFYGLRRIHAEQRFIVSSFDSPAFSPVALDELVLTQADQVGCEELLLEQALTHFGPGSRVVRLFEPAAMPTPGELKGRIDRHLSIARQAAPPDGSEALFEALAELRRSIR